MCRRQSVNPQGMATVDPPRRRQLAHDSLPSRHEMTCDMSGHDLHDMHDMRDLHDMHGMHNTHGIPDMA